MTAAGCAGAPSPTPPPHPAQRSRQPCTSAGTESALQAPLPDAPVCWQGSGHPDKTSLETVSHLMETLTAVSGGIREVKLLSPRTSKQHECRRCLGVGRSVAPLKSVEGWRRPGKRFTPAKLCRSGLRASVQPREMMRCGECHRRRQSCAARGRRSGLSRYRRRRRRAPRTTTTRWRGSSGRAAEWRAAWTWSGRPPLPYPYPAAPSRHAPAPLPSPKCASPVTTDLQTRACGQIAGVL